MSQAKEPFEKVRSLVERRKIFQTVVEQKSEIVCKANGDQLFLYEPIDSDEVIHLNLGTSAVVYGRVRNLVPTPSKPFEVIGHFSVDLDRYFFRGKFIPAGSEGTGLFELDGTCDVFKLQRRQTFRVPVPADTPIYISAHTHNRKPIQVDFKISDISVGGARVFRPLADYKLEVGDKLTGVVHSTGGKTVEFQAEVRHSMPQAFQGDVVPHFGIEFVEPTVGFKNRMMALTMDLQHKIVTGTAHRK